MALGLFLMYGIYDSDSNFLTLLFVSNGIRRGGLDRMLEVVCRKTAPLLWNPGRHRGIAPHRDGISCGRSTWESPENGRLQDSRNVRGENRASRPSLTGPEDASVWHRGNGGTGRSL